jgi:hypothetical protein
MEFYNNCTQALTQKIYKHRYLTFKNFYSLKNIIL